MQVYAESLQVAWGLVQRGTRAAGIDGITLDMFAGVAQEQIRAMMAQLRRERYLARPAKGFFLPKKSGGRRLIGIPVVGDRIIQRLVLQGIYPKLESTFSESAYAYRPGLSIYDAVDKVMERYQHPHAWVIKADIQKFFDNLSWPLLLNQLEWLGIHPFYLRLIEHQIKSGIVVEGRYCRTHKGVLQGGVLSGALANLYLNEFDHRCLDADIHLVRYGDDCVAVCHSLLEASRSLSLMQDWIADLYLTLHPEKTRIIAPGEAFTFLGHQFCNGQVQAPERKKPAKPKQRKPPAPSVGPPKACSIVRSSKQRAAFAPEHYWSDDMTTLYVSDQGAYLKVKHQQFQVIHEQEVRCSVPANRVSHIVLFGCCNVSHGAVGLALRRRIPVLYLATNGRYFGRLHTEGHAQVDYLTEQVQKSLDPEFAIRQAQSIILGKLHNSRVLLKRLARRRKSDEVEKAIAELAELMPKISEADTIASMMGYEGHGANLYFGAYAKLLKGKFPFEKRTRRPPTDPANSLLSLGYTLLSQNLHSMVEAVGLHTHFGNLHQPQKNRPSLVCDLVEEFRAGIVDSFVAYLINSNIFTEEDFTPPDGRGGVYLYPDALKKFLKHWESTLQKGITHPHTGHKVTYRRCLELQVWEYVGCLMGDRDVYRPMRWEQ